MVFCVDRLWNVTQNVYVLIVVVINFKILENDFFKTLYLHHNYTSKFAQENERKCGTTFYNNSIYARPMNLKTGISDRDVHPNVCDITE